MCERHDGAPWLDQVLDGRVKLESSAVRYLGCVEVYYCELGAIYVVMNSCWSGSGH